MCGIAGYVSSTQPAQVEILESMLRAIAHRGPDEAGGFIGGGAALGCTRLSIVDIEGRANRYIHRDCPGGENVERLFLGERLFSRRSHLRDTSA